MNVINYQYMSALSLSSIGLCHLSYRRLSASPSKLTLTDGRVHLLKVEIHALIVHSKMSANRIDLDAILVEIGELGRYQIAQYCMLCALVIFTSTPYLSYIFTSGPLEYRYVWTTLDSSFAGCIRLFSTSRCRIPEIDSANSDGRITYAPDWLPSAVPFTPDGQPERCGRYLSVEADSRTDYAHLSCVSSVCFNRSQVDRCDEFVFATDEVTIVSAVCTNVFIQVNYKMGCWKVLFCCVQLTLHLFWFVKLV